MAIFQDNKNLMERLNWLGWVFSFIFLMLFLRLWYLSIASFEQYDSIARNNQIRTLPVPAPRGLIRDRMGRVLVENTYGFDLIMFRGKEFETKRTLRFLEKSFLVSPGAIKARLLETNHYNDYQPVVVKQSLTLAQTSFLMARHSDYPLLDILERPRRFYPHRTIASHVLGYVGEVSSDELKRDVFQNHRPGDVIGKSGTERKYNRKLSGQNGLRRIRVNSKGRPFKELTPIDVVPGQELRLTIDLELQRAAEKALTGHTGSIVAMDPKSGEILALASNPTFDPNDFATKISKMQWENLLSHSGKPLQNRTIQNTYAPGSTFKIIIALASLESGLTKSVNNLFCAGSANFYGREYFCSFKQGHGRINLTSALKYSCNVYFYFLGRDLGIDRIQDFSQKFGLGQKTGVDLPGEMSGFIPSRDWKRKEINAPWYPGETISLSIGQGPILVTPLQLAVLISAVATEKLVQPHIQFSSPEKGKVGQTTKFNTHALNTIRSGLWKAVNQNGTGQAARIKGFEVSGKTGTVQTVGRTTLKRLTSIEKSKFRPNAWFIGYAPFDNPEISIVVLIENSGSGGAIAAPLAHKVFEAFYSQKFNSNLSFSDLAQIKTIELQK